MKLLSQIPLFLTAAFLPAYAELRDFQDVTGRSLRAECLALEGETVVLKLADGKIARVPLSRFAEADQAFIQEQAAAHSQGAGQEAEQINQALGFPAFNSETFTRRDAAEIAKILQIPQESNAPVGKSWRLYAAVRKKNYRLFGAVPYSVALYSDAEGKANSLSLVFANKGDFGSKVGFARDHFNATEGGSEPASLQEAMSRDEQDIGQALTAALGPAREQRFGDTGVRRTVKRWDWNGQAFLLSHVENEYVSVQVVSSAVADSGGRSALVDDASVRARLGAAVRREDNGDVWISGIPMVDQGPKGYCVPATFERAMRLMDLEADMYLLAMVGQSSGSGGTSIGLLLDNLKSQVYRKGRRIKEIHAKTLRIRDFKRYIDAGTPLLWCLCSTDAYNEAADKNGQLRGQEGHGPWLKEVQQQFARREKPESNYHICMIIGYNEKTGEVAVSDSWGASFEKRWVPVSVADWANQSQIVVIQP